MKKTDQLTGRAKGGAARAAKLTPEQRSEIARNAARAKHALHKPLVAIKKGNFKEDFGFDAECYVLNDERKTAVMSQRGMAEALGLGYGGSRLPTYVKGKTISKYLGHEIAQKLENPIIFQPVSLGKNVQPTVQTNGYDVTILIDICRAVIQAKEAGERVNINVVAQANIILGATAKLGIQTLVYKLAGYDATKDEVIAAFKAFVQEEAKKYEKEFPPELYVEWARLYQIVPPVRGKSWKNKHLTVDHVYYPLAKSNGKLLTLLRESKESDGGNKKLFQFLNEVGTRALRMHLGRILEMAESSPDKATYEAKIIDRFGGQRGLDFSN